MIHNNSRATGSLPLSALSQVKPPETIKEAIKDTSAKKPASQSPKEQLSLGSLGGLALPRLTDLNTEKKAWANAAQDGKQMPEIKFKVQQGVPAPTAIFQHLKSNEDMSDAQMNNIADFMEDIMNHGSVESSDSRWDKMSLIDVLNEGVSEFGITDKQIDLIADGDYSSAAYLDMVKDGKPIA